MKPDIHPVYRTVVFHNTRVNAYFHVGSTMRTDSEGHFIGTKRG